MRLLVSSVVVALLASGCTAREPLGGAGGATGTIEYTQQEIAPLAPGRVARVLVREGDSVRVGDTLVVMTRSGLSDEIAGLRARVAAAESQLRDLDAGPRPAEIERAQADLSAATAEAERTKREVARLSGLADRGDISRQQFDAAQTAASVAAAHQLSAQQTLRAVREGARPERIQGARAEVSTARAALDASLQGAADLILRAPTNGLIIGRHVEPGQVLAAGGSTLTVGDVVHPYVRVFVDQAFLSTVHPGDTVSATLDPFPDRHFTGRVASVSTRAEFTPRVALTRDERADLLFAVRVEFTDATGTLKAGLPLTVHFSQNPRR